MPVLTALIAFGLTHQKPAAPKPWITATFAEALGRAYLTRIWGSMEKFELKTKKVGRVWLVWVHDLAPQYHYAGEDYNLEPCTIAVSDHDGQILEGSMIGPGYVTTKLTHRVGLAITPSRQILTGILDARWISLLSSSRPTKPTSSPRLVTVEEALGETYAIHRDGTVHHRNSWVRVDNAGMRFIKAIRSLEELRP